MKMAQHFNMQNEDGRSFVRIMKTLILNEGKH